MAGVVDAASKTHSALGLPSVGQLCCCAPSSLLSLADFPYLMPYWPCSARSHTALEALSLSSPCELYAWLPGCPLLACVTQGGELVSMLLCITCIERYFNPSFLVLNFLCLCVWCDKTRCTRKWLWLASVCQAVTLCVFLQTLCVTYMGQQTPGIRHNPVRSYSNHPLAPTDTNVSQNPPSWGTCKHVQKPQACEHADWLAHATHNANIRNPL